jgi:hypothetical protein
VERVGETATNTYPYPIARAVAAYTGSFDPARRYEQLLEVAEKLVIWLGIVGLSWASRERCLDRVSHEWMEKLRTAGISLGTWMTAACLAEKEMGRAGVDFGGFGAALRAQKGGGGLRGALDDLIAERNKRSHGAAPRTVGELHQRLERLEPKLEMVLAESEFLANVRWALPVDLHFDRRSNEFEIVLQSLVGAQVIFPLEKVRQDAALNENEIYAASGDGDDLVLSPFCIYRSCPECLKTESFYPDRLIESGVRYRSFDDGHALVDPAALDELESTLNESTHVRIATEGGGRAEGGDIAASPTASGDVSGPVSPPSARLAEPDQAVEPLFYLTNRLLPIKLALRQLSRMMTVQEWPDLEEFQWEAADWARQVGRRLRKRDGRRGATYWEKLAVGFPLGKDEYKSCRAFISRFTIEWAGGRERGPMFALGLARLEGNTVGLTPEGWELAVAKNPILEGIAGDVLTDAEAALFRRQMKWSKFEAAQIADFIAAVRDTDATQAAIDERLVELHPELARDISEIRTAMIGRLKDAKVVRPIGVGPSGVVELLDAADELSG